MFKDKNLLIVGGTGSFGQEFLNYIFTHSIAFKNISLFSRDELKHFNLQQKYPQKLYPNIHFFIGDIRDKERLAEVMDDQHIIINAAAMKHVHICEQNPTECWKTNVYGSQNLIDLLAFKTHIEQLVFISSDKAVNAINVYGKSKKLAESMYLEASQNQTHCKVSVIRYGNVYGTSGSLIPILMEQRKSGKITLTDVSMQRYFIQPDKAIESVLYLLKTQMGGEILIPKSPKVKIIDLAKEIAPNCEIEIIGIRKGEKLDEELLSDSEMQIAQESEDFYLITASK